MNDFSQLFAATAEAVTALSGLEGLLDSPAVDDETRALVADTLSALGALDNALADRVQAQMERLEIEADSADYTL